MYRRFLVHRARVRAMVMGGGLLAAAAVFGSSIGQPDSAVFASKEAGASKQVQAAFRLPSGLPRHGVPTCSRSARQRIALKDDPLGTMGAGLSCTGAPRRVCGEGY
jgi:hypothetical protein